MPHYTLRLMATYRVPSMLEIEADNDAEAISIAKAANLREFVLDHHAVKDSDIEGDEIVYIDTWEDSPDNALPDEGIDRRPDGEPFSWEAVEFVKQIARLQTDEELEASGCESPGDDAIDSMNSIIARARALVRSAQ